MDWLTKSILPNDHLNIAFPESARRFVLTMVSDCLDEEGIQDFMTGLKLFPQYIQDKYQTSFQALNAEQHILMFTELANSEIVPDALKFFMATTKQLTVRHFTTSQHFMETYLEYEFVPGRFEGCVPRNIVG